MVIFRYVFIAVIVFLFSCRDRSDTSEDAMKAYAQYLTGISLLQGNRNVLRFDQQAMRTEQLQHVTGIDNDSMVSYLLSLKNHPERGYNLYSEMKKLDIQKPDSVQLSKK